MDFKLDEAEVRALAQLEEEAGCDISAGADWETRLGDPLAMMKRPIDQEKLMALLQEGLGEVLSLEEVEALAKTVQDQARQQVMLKMQPAQSA